jgi:hypothetical protein
MMSLAYFTTAISLTCRTPINMSLANLIFRAGLYDKTWTHKQAKADVNS